MSKTGEQKERMYIISFSTYSLIRLRMVLNDYIKFGKDEERLRDAIYLYNMIVEQSEEYDKRRELYYGMAGE